LKEKGYIVAELKNSNERVIRTTGRFKRIPNDKLNEIENGRRELAKKFKI
jgi:hypothetical protein